MHGFSLSFVERLVAQRIYQRDYLIASWRIACIL